MSLLIFCPYVPFHQGTISQLKLDELFDLLLKVFLGLGTGEAEVADLLTILEEEDGGD